MLHHETEGWFRLAPFVEGSHSIDVVSNAAEAYEAAKQFGKFTKMLRGFDAGSLQLTLPQFHDLEIRFAQFQKSQHTGSAERKKAAGNLMDFLKSKEAIVEEYRNITSNTNFKIRVTHHDTKISNVLFDEMGKGICVIDLDTVMPGYFISDVGDMMRTYLSPASEEEKDFSRIEVRDDYFIAIVKGYLSEMQAELSATEKRYFVYAGKFLIYMQAMRFAADYLNNDHYYGQKYEGQNLVRATNQTVLLQKLLDKEALLQSKVAALDALSISG
jgi:Ser/Thr protein kinase RdoA (MazF antagonist)